MNSKSNMKILFSILLVISIFSCNKVALDADVNRLQNGDIIFQTSTSAQSKAIQLATHSKYSHCGLIYKDIGGHYFVLEAIQPVTKTPLLKWIARGKDAHFVVKRLKDTSALTPKALRKMKDVGTEMIGRNYDLYFEWSNDRIYCSELIWKIYKQGTGLEIGHLQKLKDFDLHQLAVKQKLIERYGKNIPKEEKVISPSAIFYSNLLYTVITE